MDTETRYDPLFMGQTHFNGGNTKVYLCALLSIEHKWWHGVSPLNYAISLFCVDKQFPVPFYYRKLENFIWRCSVLEVRS